MPGITSITLSMSASVLSTAQGEDQGALGQGVAQAGADEDVGGPERPGGAGGAGVDDDAFVVQHHHQALAFDVFHRHREADAAGTARGGR